MLLLLHRPTKKIKSFIAFYFLHNLLEAILKRKVTNGLLSSK